MQPISSNLHQCGQMLTQEIILHLYIRLLFERASGQQPTIVGQVLVWCGLVAAPSLSELRVVRSNLARL
jgi:hypothetical protein